LTKGVPLTIGRLRGLGPAALEPRARLSWAGYGGDVAEQILPGAVAVVLASGSMNQIGDNLSEVSFPLAGRFMASWTLDSLRRVPEVVRTILVTRGNDVVRAEVVAREVPHLDVEVIEGGRSRHQSEHQAFQHLAKDIQSGTVDVILVHDADRPLCRPAMMQTAIAIAREVGGAVPLLDGHHLMAASSDGSIREIEPRPRYVRLQAPQAFRARSLFQAYEAASRAGFEAEDTHSSVQRFSDLEVRFFKGEERNMKIASSDDVFLAERILANDHHGLS
jgi:2-C-methyl-D-erythritol 4-phosphate cytidylyltransferase